jgi:hypothetical protein
LELHIRQVTKYSKVKVVAFNKVCISYRMGVSLHDELILKNQIDVCFDLTD